jgi:hypothetical protein
MLLACFLSSAFGLRLWGFALRAKRFAFRPAFTGMTIVFFLNTKTSLVEWSDALRFCRAPGLQNAPAIFIHDSLVIILHMIVVSHARIRAAAFFKGNAKFFIRALQFIL